MSIVKRISDSYSIVGTGGNTVVSIGTPTSGTGQLTINGSTISGVVVANIPPNIASTIDSFDGTVYQAAKYVVSVSNSSVYQISEILVVQDGINAYVSAFGDISTTGNTFVIFDVSMAINTVTVTANTSISGNATARLQKTYFPK